MNSGSKKYGNKFFVNSGTKYFKSGLKTQKTYVRPDQLVKGHVLSQQHVTICFMIVSHVENF